MAGGRAGQGGDTGTRRLVVEVVVCVFVCVCGGGIAGAHHSSYRVMWWPTMTPWWFGNVSVLFRTASTTCSIALTCTSYSDRRMLHAPRRIAYSYAHCMAYAARGTLQLRCMLQPHCALDFARRAKCCLARPPALAWLLSLNPGPMDHAQHAPLPWRRAGTAAAVGRAPRAPLPPQSSARPMVPSASSPRSTAGPGQCCMLAVRSWGVCGRLRQVSDHSRAGGYS
jgi:hypothetical protein